MKLQDFIHASTRISWTARLLAYVALVATVALVVQVVHAFLL